MFADKKFGLPQDLINSVKKVIEENRQIKNEEVEVIDEINLRPIIGGMQQLPRLTLGQQRSLKSAENFIPSTSITNPGRAKTRIPTKDTPPGAAGRTPEIPTPPSSTAAGKASASAPASVPAAPATSTAPAAAGGSRLGRIGAGAGAAAVGAAGAAAILDRSERKKDEPLTGTGSPGNAGDELTPGGSPGTERSTQPKTDYKTPVTQRDPSTGTYGLTDKGRAYVARKDAEEKKASSLADNMFKNPLNPESGGPTKKKKVAESRLINAFLALQERKHHKGKKLDPVGQEDEDVNNDGKVNSTDKYLKHRRNVISKNIKEEETLEEDVERLSYHKKMVKQLMRKLEDDPSNSSVKERLNYHKKMVRQLDESVDFSEEELAHIASVLEDYPSVSQKEIQLTPRGQVDRSGPTSVVTESGKKKHKCECEGKCSCKE